MDANYMTLAAFAFVCLLLLTLPFIPAFREWRQPSDVAALPISANYTSDIDHFSRRLALDAAAKLGLGPATGFEDFDFVDFPVDNMQWQKARKRLIARQSIQTQTPVKSPSQLYVDGNFQSGEKSEFSSLYATGDIVLGSASEVHDWAHADGVFRLGNNGIALRRISAGVAIELGN